MFKSEKLKEIVIQDANTKEVLAVITDDGNIIQRDDVLVRENYTKEYHNYEEKDNKIYIVNDDIEE
jgi:hypothetical protein